MITVEKHLKVKLSEEAKNELKKVLEQTAELMTALLGEKMEAELNIGIKEFGSDDWDTTFSYNQFQGHFIQDMN